MRGGVILVQLDHSLVNAHSLIMLPQLLRRTWRVSRVRVSGRDTQHVTPTKASCLPDKASLRVLFWSSLQRLILFSSFLLRLLLSESRGADAKDGTHLKHNSEAHT